jgi:hypothetical protein
LIIKGPHFIFGWPEAKKIITIKQINKWQSLKIIRKPHSILGGHKKDNNNILL